MSVGEKIGYNRRRKRKNDAGLCVSQTDVAPDVPLMKVCKIPVEIKQLRFALRLILKRSFVLVLHVDEFQGCLSAGKRPPSVELPKGVLRAICVIPPSFEGLSFHMRVAPGLRNAFEHGVTYEYFV